MAKTDSEKYVPSAIEPKWQEAWTEEKIYSPDMKQAKRPFYNLMMFPYPSAEGLHVGNMYAQTGADVYGRFKRMQGLDVFEPIGLDGFGIHSENYALKVGTHPMKQAEVSEKNFYRQMKAIGTSVDWQRTVETYDPSYYKWTQWLFTEMFRAGLAYRKKEAVNWCPGCKTVLSDEQVIAGECERCGSLVEKRELEQWFFRITQYAQKLLDNLEKLDWTEKVKIAQKNWIGRSEGAKVEFRIQNLESTIEVFTTRPDTLFGATFMVVSPEHPLVRSLLNSEFKIQGAELEEVKRYVEQAKKKTEQERMAEGKEKTGVFSGLYAINPVNNEQIPIWIADYVLMGYGTGAIMAVPAHDERDYAFAKKYDLPIKRVIEPKFVNSSGESAVKPELDFVKRDAVCAIVRNPKDDTYLCIKWKDAHMQGLVTGGIEDGEDIVEAARREVHEETGYKNLRLVEDPSLVMHSLFYHRLKKQNRWARFHYVFFELENEEKDVVGEKEAAMHEVVWKKKEDLKDFFSVVEGDFLVTLIDNPEYVFTGQGILGNSGEFNGMESEDAKVKIVESVNGEMKVQYHLRDWLISRQRYWGPPIPMVYCSNCAEKGVTWFAKHDQENPSDWNAAGWFPVETNNLPVELPYIEDFKPLGTGKAPLANHPEFYETTCPVCGGAATRETDVSDTFLDSAWYFLRYPSSDIESVPFDIDITKKWLPVDIYIGGAEHSVLHLLYARFITMALADLKLVDFEEPFSKFFAHGLIIKDGAKMSKSKGNVVVPDEYIAKYGADTLRMYLMFLGPFNQGGDFRDTGIEGMHRFVKRVWNFLHTVDFADREDKEVTKALHKTIKAVTEDLGSLSYNTAIARLMEFYNLVSKQESITKDTAIAYIKLFAPFAPYLAEEMYQSLTDNAGKDLVKNSVHISAWPEYKEEYLQEEVVTVTIQVNGKRRGEMQVDTANIANREQVEEQAYQILADRVDKEKVKKAIYVPGKIINFVV